MPIVVTLNTAWTICNFRRPLIRALRKEGYRVICFAPEDEYTSLLTEEDIEIQPIYCLDRKGTNPVQDLRLILELEKAYKKYRRDLAIHFTIKPNIYGSIAANRLGIPSVAVVTGLGYTFLSGGLASRAARFLYKYAFSRNNLTVFQNPDDQSLFVSKALVRKKRTIVIPGSEIDMDFYAVTPEIPYSPVYLFVGRLLHHKGIKELLEGFRLFSGKYPDAKLVVVGDVDDDNPASLTEVEVKKWRDHPGIIFEGFQKDVRPFIQQSSIVVLPSYREGLPRTMLEALSMGRPVITTDVPGCREVVRPGKNGWMVPAQNAEALADAFEEFYRLPKEEQKRMGQQSRKMAEEKFSTEVVNQQFLEVIKKILL